MGRHGRNATANPVYSNFERGKDNSHSGYGTQKRRLGSDSMDNVDCCCLSLQPAENPVITPYGHIYDKAAILENLLHQKREMNRQLKEYERMEKQQEQEMAELAAAQRQAEIEEFQKQESSIRSTVGSHFEQKQEELSHASAPLRVAKEAHKTAKGKVEPALPAFWLPAFTPEAKASLPKKPDGKTRCPMTNKPLRVKDLITVNFTLADPESTQALAGRKERFICPLTQTTLRNAVPCVVLRPSGRCITKEAYERLVRPDMTDPLSGEKLTEEDVIEVQGGGTGFAASGGGPKVAQVVKPAMMAG